MHQRDFMGQMWARTGLAIIALSGLRVATAQTQTLELSWAMPSDGSWQAETVSLGAEGTEVFSEYGSYLNARVLLSTHDVNPPTPVWNDANTTWNHVRRVDSSARGGVHVAMHQEYGDSTQTWRRPIMRKYSSNSASPDWEYTSNVVISNHENTEVRVSEDGSRIVSIIYNVSGSVTQLTVFNSESPIPEKEIAINTTGACKGVAMSADGKRVALRSQYKLSVVDLDSGATLLAKYYMMGMFAGALDISGDGEIVAVIEGEQLHVFHWNGTAFNTPTAISLPSGSYTRALGLSEDGSTLALASNFYSNPGNVRVQMMSASNQTVFVDHLVTAPGSLLNAAEAIRLSADGNIAVVGLWGDEYGTIPELLVFDREHSGIVASGDLPGSVNELDLSPDGHMVVAAAKGTHANVFGGGGGLYLFETSSVDFDLVGVPSIGNTVYFRQELNPGDLARVLVSPTLSSDPRIFAGVGLLWLDETNLSVLPGYVTADQSGEAWTATEIPNQSVLIGTTLYYQGLGLTPRNLSTDYERVTILP